MKLAIEVAKKAYKEGKLPAASIIVKNGEIIAKGISLVATNLDPSSHNDSVAIRNACKELAALDLSDCILYSTIEPCSMCLAGATWAGVSQVVFGAYQEDIKNNPYELKDYHAEEHAKRLFAPFTNKEITVIGGVLRKECAELMKNIINWTSAK